MKTKHWVLLFAGCIIFILGIITFFNRGRVPGNDSQTSDNDMSITAPKKIAVSFNEAKEQAIEIINERTQWPESPVAVCGAFWIARANKDYSEMEILWPGSASLNWEEICSNDPKVEYVFGKASADGTRVPYASEDYYEKNRKYNLTMHMATLDTDKGLRYYVVSGN